MHRTQIYLQDELYETLKTRSHSLDVSISELIRRTLEQGIKKDPATDAKAFFDRLNPLESFTKTDPETYVRELRANSRLLREQTDDA